MRFVARHFYSNPFASVAAFVVVVNVASDVVVVAATPLIHVVSSVFT